MGQGVVTKKKNGAHIIVVGNEKGGSGKSTTAMHIVISLLERDFNVAVVDLDARQPAILKIGSPMPINMV